MGTQRLRQRATPPPIATTKSTTAMNRMTAALLLLLLGTATAVTAAPSTRTIEILSSPIVLKYGEVHNRYQEPLALPEDVVAHFANGTMAIVDYKLDVVYENGSRVPLTDIYQHHYIFTMGSEDTMKAYYKYMQDAPYGAKTDGLEGWVKGAKNPVDFAQEQKKNKAHNRKLMMSTMAMKHSLRRPPSEPTRRKWLPWAAPAVRRSAAPVTSSPMDTPSSRISPRPSPVSTTSSIPVRLPASPRSSSRKERPASCSSVLAPLRESSMRTMALLMGGPPSPPSAHAARNSSI